MVNNPFNILIHKGHQLDIALKISKMCRVACCHGLIKKPKFGPSSNKKLQRYKILC